MKKHLLKLLLLCCTGILALSLFACVPTTEQYKLDFIVDGKVYNSCTTSGNSRVTLPSDPTKTAYIFKGWYFDEGKWTKEFNAHSFEKDPIEKDVNIYAKFELDKTHTCNKVWRTELAASCLSEGKKVQRCSYPECAKVYAVETIPVVTGRHTGEVEAVKTNVIPATCTLEGSYTEMYYCSVCKAKLEGEEGEKTFKIEIDNNAHKFIDDINHTKLVRDGDVFNLNVKCEYCAFGVNLTNVDVTEKIEKEATCIETGSKYYTCSVYGVEFISATETIPAKGHYINGIAIEDKVYSEETHSKIFSKIHLIDDGNSSQVADCWARELTGIYECDVCHTNNYISVLKPHVGTWVKTADPECYKDGKEVLASCSECEAKNAERIIPRTEAHKDGETILVKDGNKFHLAVACAKRSEGCTHVELMVENVEVTKEEIISKDCKKPDVIRYTHTNGSKSYQYDEIIAEGPILNGVRVETIMDPAGWIDYRYVGNGIKIPDNITLTCDTLTFGMYICESCGEHYSVDVYRPHNGSWSTTKQPTCTSTGISSFKCDLCDYGHDGSVTKTLEKLDHNYDFKLGVASNNTFYLEGQCVCGKTDRKDNVFVAVNVAKEPTCKEKGEIIYTCKYNGSTYELKEEISVLDHSLGNEYIPAGTRLEYVKYVKNGSVKMRFANIGCTSSVEDTANDMAASYICSECGVTVEVKVYRLHDLKAHITYDTNNSPCVVSGVRKYSCSYYGCGYETASESFAEENHNYIATLTTNSNGTQKIVAECNVDGCGSRVIYDNLASVAVKIKAEANCVSMGYVEYTFSYAGETITLDAEIERGNHVLNGADFETLKVNGKLPANITTFIKVGSDYFFKCEECGMLVRVDVAAN